jgi:hypothetical protein
MTPLQELVVNRMAELNLSLRDASDKTVVGRNGDGKEERLLSHAAISNIRLGKHGGGFTDRTLKGLSLALELPLSTIKARAAESFGPQETEFRLPKKAAKERKLILNMVNALLHDAEAEDDAGR